MMGASILSMTDFQIENAIHSIVELTQIIKIDPNHSKRQIKLKRIETILGELKSKDETDFTSA